MVLVSLVGILCATVRYDARGITLNVFHPEVIRRFNLHVGLGKWKERNAYEVSKYTFTALLEPTGFLVHTSVLVG